MKIPAFTLPAALSRIASRLPQTPPTLALIALLNLGVGRVVARQTLEPLLDKRMLLVVSDAGLRLRFVLTARGFQPSFSPLDPDLTITASARDFLALALREEDPDTLFFSRRLLMEGDTELGLLVKNSLDQVELPRLKLPSLNPRELLDRFLFSGTR